MRHLNATNIASRARAASLALQASSARIRTHVLMTAARLLTIKRRAILSANRQEVARARARVTRAFLDRLTLTERRFHEMVAAVRDIARQVDPLGEEIEARKIANGVRLKKIRVPIGTLFVIYEARPHVTADAAALALRAGNAVVLKGGSEALGANRLIAQCFVKALQYVKLPSYAVQFIDTANRAVVRKLLKEPEYIDLVIPRGGYGLVRWVRAHAEMPSLSHAEGLDHIYVDASADLRMAVKVIVNAKTNFPAGCNALDHVLVHQRIARTLLPLLDRALRPYGVELRADAAARRIIKAKPAVGKDWDTEYLDLTMGIKIVSGVEEASMHINTHGSKHSEGIMAKDRKIIEQFKTAVDAAGIFINCSTRLHDGGVFGLGAEMGINTGKLHARGPVGAKELTTYKWIAEGKGQVRE